MKINIGVIFGGRSGEYEVSLQSARAIVSPVSYTHLTLPTNSRV